MCNERMIPEKNVCHDLNDTGEFVKLFIVSMSCFVSSFFLIKKFLNFSKNGKVVFFVFF